MAKSSRPNWILRIACVLLCLTIISVHLTSGMMARYSTTVSGSDSARVAKFDVSYILKEKDETAENLYLLCEPGMTINYEIVLKNDSEVTVDCTVTVKKLSDNTPITFSLGQSTVQLAPGASQTFNLTITWDRDMNDASYAFELDAIRVIVDAVQVD